MDWSTKIERDPQHEQLRKRAVAVLRSGTLRWRHHGIGVLQAYVLESQEGPLEERLHIWSRSLLKPGIDESGDAHDHRFDMVSHVLFGTVGHTEILPVKDERAGQWTMMDLVHARAAGAENNFHAPMRATQGRFSIAERYQIIRAGELYRFPRGVFHRSPVSGFAITWVEKRNQCATPARIIHPIDIPAVPAFGHEPGDVPRLVDLALRVLE